ncbi:hypothetical protein [Algoriphagus sp. A40]|uniref:hypothetical protein n=1 Tax=Algoriphagus sp. A40 TaxID=1945863 RepID=UPI000986F5CF|nr:hypothetical protein [Algoriphagus sp. A40]OOG73131.1 hypothetical protein B0E43_14570 [Algoriphagus sp. A40]
MYYKIKTLVGVLIIGAIGSLLYDVLLKDFFFFLGSIFVSVATFIYSGYVDHLYSDVGKGGLFFQVLPAVLIVTIILCSPYYFYNKINRVYAKQDSPVLETGGKFNPITYLVQRKKRMNVFISVMGIPIIIIYSDMLIKEVSTIKACRKIERNLDIIRPHIGEKNYHILYSDYRQIDGKSKLIDLINDINIKAKKAEVDLPEINLLGL